ncbi:sulfate ABC transporter permease subunit CysT [Rhizosaccharibacter radicis]|uniref:Sulfate transport system permease protein CysT n=1 Tax=Rhizosaccharibacter radicis TaxID=2782605 RepID=A0ABT1W128_9PROT|nr:sulfate ABC transporter permease subunit CysT [Acetobacteraceae bacterium KSS12]
MSHSVPQAPGLRRLPFGVPAVIPGRTLSFGLTLFWVTALVVLPLTALATKPFGRGFKVMLHALGDARALHALALSFGCALGAASLCTLLGLLLAWVLERVRPPGWRLLDALVDIPFALPTAVAGITLTSLYAPTGWIGAPLDRLGIKVAFTPLGITLALVFVGLPFVVRTVLPVLRELPRELEEAAETLGARPGQIARRVLLPALAPALATGFGLAFARGVGEYGSVIFIAGNRPMVSEIAPLLIVIRLQEFNYAGASAIGLVMLLAAALCLLAITALRRRLPASLGVRLGGAA